MTAFFSNGEVSLLIRLLIAHCLTDFLLQPRKWVEHKMIHNWKSEYLWYHGLLTGIVAWIFLWNLNYWYIVLGITVTHIVIDGLKISLGKSLNKKSNYDLLLFTTDQLLHVLIIMLLWLYAISGWFKMNLLLNRYLPDYRLLLRVFGYLLMIGPVGFFVQFLTRKWMAELNMEDSLKDAGRWIGLLERVLIITFIYTDQFGSIGFLIAAKSLLRLTDKPEKTNNDTGLDKPFSSRKHTEYVLIGTFLSFGIAIITGLIINRFLQ
ncbi:MAG: DUF3307 domain-containing protein [Chitinophagaceae bacterium]